MEFDAMIESFKGVRFNIKIGYNDTVKTLKEKIKKYIKYNGKIKLLYNNNILNNNSNLYLYNIHIFSPYIIKIIK